MSRHRIVLPHFALKELLVGMGLIAAGLSMLVASRSLILADRSGWGAALPLGLWYLGAAYVGAGLFAPFRVARVGVWLGLAASCLYVWRH
jgi:hypothetical protein